MASVLDPLWWSRLSNKNLVRNHVSGGSCKRIKIRVGICLKIQLKKSYNGSQPLWEAKESQFIASKGGLISLESFIAAKAKIATLMRRIEALETKEPANVNQINPPPIHNPDCSYCQAPNHVFKECPIFQTHQVLPEHIDAAYSRSQHIPYSQTYNHGWRNHPNFLEAQTILLGSIFPTISPSQLSSKFFQSSFIFLLPKFTNGEKTQ